MFAMRSARATWTDAQHQAAGTQGRDTVKVVHSIPDLLYYLLFDWFYTWPFVITTLLIIDFPKCNNFAPNLSNL